jgi:hypothetical protein
MGRFDHVELNIWPEQLEDVLDLDFEHEGVLKLLPILCGACVRRTEHVSYV